ncbi:siderophore-interacting protein [Paracoccus sp. CPCC 101403]|uniref:Siderophore-interacting protein n=1 Tax=Paracoccus broussonetiae TaxID=3075834 RepID=A0ABU3EAJ1_9RHOB|nr:siderophore-interacting protein [Paracoccus sp. CPCC 101403]MDT1060485.1 siderophore-interacting protein [Paracoccus sp. CPCC 101403]
MRLTTPPEFHSEAILTDTDFGLLDRILRAEAEEHGLDLHDGHGRSTWCETEMGEFGVKRRGNDALVFARAHSPEWLASIQEAIFEHLSETLPDLGQRLRWSSPADAGKIPLNFSLARVERVDRISADFVRMRLAGPDLRRLATRDSIHFRLVLPSTGDTAPEWPRIGENGQTVWPKGDKALHRPVYTVRAIDEAQGWLDFDIFLHAGGRVSEWALSGPKGRTVGLSGPNGGGIPDAASLVLAGDETAWPAIARILAERPDADASVWLMGARADYPLPLSTRTRVTHLPEGPGELVRILRETPPSPQTMLWMACEKTVLASLRGFLLDELGHDRHQTHLGAYWTRAVTQNFPA